MKPVSEWPQPSVASPTLKRHAGRICRLNHAALPGRHYLPVPSTLPVLEVTVMLRHAATLGMLITSGLIFALGSAGPMTLVGLAMLGVGLGIEIAAWGRVARVHRAHSDQWLG